MMLQKSIYDVTDVISSCCKLVLLLGQSSHRIRIGRPSTSKSEITEDDRLVEAGGILIYRLHTFVYIGAKMAFLDPQRLSKLAT